MEARKRYAEETLLVNHNCFFPPKGYINQMKEQTYFQIKKEETWFVQNEDDGEYEEPLQFVRFTCDGGRKFTRQSRKVKNFLEIDFIELVVKENGRTTAS